MSHSNTITLNIGGQLFQTTVQTLSLTSPTSPLSSLSPSSPPPFFDRDPSLFSHLLSFLRTFNPPSPPLLPSLLEEAKFFSFPPSLISSLSLPPVFNPFSLLPSVTLPLTGRDPVTSISVSSSVVVTSHGGKVTAFDPSLTHKTTVLTPLPFIDSLYPLSSSLAAAGAGDFPGLHLINLQNKLNNSSCAKILHWDPHPSLAKSSNVLAIVASSDRLFASFESSRRNSSVILSFDLEKFESVMEIARKEIFGAEIDSAIPAMKLNWVDQLGLLMASGSHSGPAGLSGYISFWDPRANKSVYEFKEGNLDCFADVTVSDSLLSVFKIGVNSGDVFMSDLRRMGESENWVCIGEGKRVSEGKSKREGNGCKIESYGRNVFVTRGGDVELWSDVEMAGGEERVMKRNWLGRERDRREKKKITHLCFGGNRMVLARKEELCLEVWESSQ